MEKLSCCLLVYYYLYVVLLHITTSLEIRLGTRQLQTQMPRQVTIFHSLPRQKNAEAIPPVVP